MSIKRFELYFLKVIRGEKKGMVATLLRGVLWFCSLFFRVGVRFRNWAYNHGFFRSYTPPIPLVISVGNLVAGGTGKTPVTLKLGEALADGYSVAVLTRGYRSQVEKLAKPVVLSDGQGPMHPATYCGDEPYLMASRLPKATVIVGRDRHQSSLMAAKRGAHVILMDDGMQHRNIVRDLEVVVVDVRDPFGGGYFLPRGLLREGVDALARADLVILNHADDPEKLKSVKESVIDHTSAPIVATRLTVEAICDLSGAPQELPTNHKVGSFCGIAHPAYFRQTLVNLGLDVVKEYILPDHETLHSKKLQQFSKDVIKKGAECLICTEKDQVKLSASLNLPLPIYWTKTSLTIVEGESNWNAFVARSQTYLKHHV
ncbi:MAG: tetraacyldisaccharide 4'-kinase [Chlamydiia bacterium]|nr:tetraacyldisaccharide 4'-kinase [Chlamydiia bacterium]